MAETKLTAELFAWQAFPITVNDIHSQYNYEKCLAAINEYAAQQQGEHERVLDVLRRVAGLYHTFLHEIPGRTILAFEDCDNATCKEVAALLAADKEAPNAPVPKNS